MKYLLTAGMALLMSVTTAVAAPLISGNTLWWPDDGWYQVQTSDTYEEVCAGGRFCEVEAGNYIVINHHTGERFTNVEIFGDLPSPILVAGNTIVWPDDGWYQVQTSDTYEEICGGGRYCDVTPGTYNVINHSTGERFTDIDVFALDRSASPIHVVRDTIVWPDDGWYQVQTSDTYEEVCAGGRFCEVVAGNYIVINHHTGERFTDVKVFDGSPSSILVAGNTIVWPDDGWYQVQTSDTYEEICGGGRFCDVTPGTYNVINHTSGQRFTDIEVPVLDSSASRVQVVRDTIVWPDDGWYQVQTSDTYEEVCAGGRFCKVEPGSYIVINHHTGQRFTDIRVYEYSESPVVVVGNTIGWPDNGWYQVQTSDTYEEICGGGRFCDVEPGTYNVINHSSGVRYENVTVGSTDGDSLSFQSQ